MFSFGSTITQLIWWLRSHPFIDCGLDEKLTNFTHQFDCKFTLHASLTAITALQFYLFIEFFIDLIFIQKLVLVRILNRLVAHQLRVFYTIQSLYSAVAASALCTMWLKQKSNEIDKYTYRLCSRSSCWNASAAIFVMRFLFKYKYLSDDNPWNAAGWMVITWFSFRKIVCKCFNPLNAWLGISRMWLYRRSL